MNKKLGDLKKSVLEDGVIDANEVRTINDTIYEDGTIDREEADFMFELNDAVTGKENDATWTELFVNSITDHVLKDEVSSGFVDDDEADYLISKIDGDGTIDTAEQQLLLNILESANGTCEKYQNYVLDKFKDIILEDGVIDEHEVNTIKRIIYSEGGIAGSSIDKKEADWLFDLNDAVSGKANHVSWKHLMADAITKFVLEDENSPNVLDDEEANWLSEKIMGDGKLDEVEQEIINKIKEKALKISNAFKF